MIKIDTNFVFFLSSRASDVPDSFLSSSSQWRVTRTVESLQVIGLQAGVNVESNETSHFVYVFFCIEMAPNML